MSNDIHPGWNGLLKWLADRGASINPEGVSIEVRETPGAGYGLIAQQDLQQSSQLLRVPSNALMNILTLTPLYPSTARELTAIQLTSLHLFLNCPLDDHFSEDIPFGPYISTLPKDFSFHPLTWLCCQPSSSISTMLHSNLPKTTADKLAKLANRLQADWATVYKYLQGNAIVTKNRISEALKEPITTVATNYIWAWLIVNTRCIYCWLNHKKSHPDNMTLAPIVDFANHVASKQSLKVDFSKKLGGDLILSLPGHYNARVGEELHLTYGHHSNNTLFVEYGFINRVEGSKNGEAVIDDLLMDRFGQGGSLGTYYKQVLQENGYWGDWTIHLQPELAYPTYRTITALRLYHLFDSSVSTVPPDVELRLEIWRQTMLGRRDIVSPENEAAWRDTLRRLCEELVALARQRMAGIPQDHSRYPNWVRGSLSDIKSLFEEEIAVGLGVCQSIEDNVDF